MLTIAGGILLAVCILSFVQLMIEALVNSKSFERFVGGLGRFIIGYERGARGEVTQPPVVYGRGAQEPSLSNRQTFLRVCLVLGVGFIICVSIVAAPVVQAERMEHTRIAFTTAQNLIVADMPGHTYRFDSEGNVFIILSTEPIYPDTPERLLREKVIDVPSKVADLKAHGFRFVNLGYATVELP